MFILINKQDNSVWFNGISMEHGIFDEPIEKWKIERDGMTFYVIGGALEKLEVDTLPSDYEDLMYCYTEEKGFYLNENYRALIDPEEEIRILIQENIDLKAQLDKVQEVLDYLVMQ